MKKHFKYRKVLKLKKIYQQKLTEWEYLKKYFKHNPVIKKKKIPYLQKN